MCDLSCRVNVCFAVLEWTKDNGKRENCKFYDLHKTHCQSKEAFSSRNSITYITPIEELHDYYNRIHEISPEKNRIFPTVLTMYSVESTTIFPLNGAVLIQLRFHPKKENGNVQPHFYHQETCVCTGLMVVVGRHLTVNY